MPAWSPASSQHHHRYALAFLFLVVLLGLLLWAFPAHGGPAMKLAVTHATASVRLSG